MARKDPSVDFKPIVQDVALHFEKELSDSIAELNEAVIVGEGEASFSCTIQIKKGKKGKFTATMKSRVRAPRAPIEISMHLNTKGQLELGYNEIEHAPPEEEEEGEEE